MNTEDANSFDVIPSTGCLENRLWGCASLKWYCIPLIREQSHWRVSVTCTTKEGACAIYRCKPLMELKLCQLAAAGTTFVFKLRHVSSFQHLYIYAYVALKAIVWYKQIVDAMPNILANYCCNVKSSVLSLEIVIWLIIANMSVVC